MKKFVALVSALVVLLAGCSGDSSSGSNEGGLPEAQTLLDESSEAMDGVTTVGFALNVEGEIAGLGIKSAEGTIKADGNVQATALVSIGGRTVEYQYFLVDGKDYLKGPTGGFQDLPAELAQSFFNPGALLSGETSLSKGLALSEEAETEAEEEVNGVDSYRITAKVDPASVEGLSLLASSARQDATLWISKDDKYLVKATMQSDGPGEDATVLTVNFSDFNEDVEITAPV